MPGGRGRVGSRRSRRSLNDLEVAQGTVPNCDARHVDGGALNPRVPTEQDDHTINASWDFDVERGPVERAVDQIHVAGGAVE
eukprot:CAMPEP_0182908180 /NCGR_PEP_ID=MMETSP0034_2-20130328/35057_1 /TAXON_ID=156128 /ORGANISM="Nephroselmis pyriformis, Strain CCMP717" /LENGTH=81 /DNA_ID=CAMNT_0025044323 /DNA_START=170 /DNA_END=416 /DNA_ORIENTATION=-